MIQVCIIRAVYIKEITTEHYTLTQDASTPAAAFSNRMFLIPLIPSGTNVNTYISPLLNDTTNCSSLMKAA